LALLLDENTKLLNLVEKLFAQSQDIIQRLDEIEEKNRVLKSD